MVSECTPLRRADVGLDPDKLQQFMASCVTQGDCLADVFLGINIFLEQDGQLTLEFLPTGGGFRFITFDHGEWSPADTASDDAMRLFKRFCRKPDQGGVYDIFTGSQLNEHQLQARRKRHDEKARLERDWGDERFAF